MEIYPSLISAEILNLKHVIQTFDDQCDGYHIDVMDDHFVPNLTWGPMFVNAIREQSRLPLHIHLMVDNPEAWLNRLTLHHGDTFIFHCEVHHDVEQQLELITHIHMKELKAGIAINPKTRLEKINDLVPVIDNVLLMSVEPGFSGQHFIPDVTDKIQPLLAMKKQSPRLFKIGMDGGINTHNIGLLAHQKIDYVAAAAAIFNHHSPVDALKRLYSLIKTDQH
jgi:ribulose-phosphate 3-epimerase